MMDEARADLTQLRDKLLTMHVPPHKGYPTDYVNPDGPEAWAVIEGLVGALKPFKRALDEWGEDDEHPDQLSLWEHPVALNLTLGDLRRAMACLSPILNEPAKEE